MSKNIDLVGGFDRAEEIVKYHSSYFKNYQWYDCVKKCLIKKKPEKSTNKIVYMNFLIGELRKESSNESV